jgi:hypothetical protein
MAFAMGPPLMEDGIMADLLDRCLDLKKEILDADPDLRLGYEAQLGRMINAMEDQDIPVPPEIRDLHEELVNENIEAQFNNMPV